MFKDVQPLSHRMLVLHLEVPEECPGGNSAPEHIPEDLFMPIEDMTLSYCLLSIPPGEGGLAGRWESALTVRIRWWTSKGTTAMHGHGIWNRKWKCQAVLCGCCQRWLMDHRPEAQAKTLWVNHESSQHLPFQTISWNFLLCNSHPLHTTPGVSAHIPTKLGPPSCVWTLPSPVYPTHSQQAGLS